MMHITRCTGFTQVHALHLHNVDVPRQSMAAGLRGTELSSSDEKKFQIQTGDCCCSVHFKITQWAEQEIFLHNTTTLNLNWLQFMIFTDNIVFNETTIFSSNPLIQVHLRPLLFDFHSPRHHMRQHLQLYSNFVVSHGQQINGNMT